MGCYSNCNSPTFWNDFKYKSVFNLPESHEKTDKIKAKRNGIVKERSRIVICFYCVFLHLSVFSEQMQRILIKGFRSWLVKSSWWQLRLSEGRAAAHCVLLEFRWRFCVRPGTWLNILWYMPKNLYKYYFQHLLLSFNLLYN